MPIHIEAEEKALSKVVLLPGDPNRAEYIAKNFLTDVIQYNSNRLMLGFTGKYKDKLISIQSTGMGTPSISIIIEELIMLKVNSLIRIGTCGAINNNLNLTDLVIATGAHSTHTLFRDFNNSIISGIPDFKLTNMLLNSAEKFNFTTHYGTIVTSEFFYESNFDLYEKFSNYNTLAVEMETYPLFVISNKNKIKSASVLTVSDLVFNKKRADKDILKKGIDNMIKFVLETIVENYDYLKGTGEW